MIARRVVCVKEARVCACVCARVPTGDRAGAFIGVTPLKIPTKFLGTPSKLTPKLTPALPLLLKPLSDGCLVYIAAVDVVLTSLSKPHQLTLGHSLLVPVGNSAVLQVALRDASGRAGGQRQQQEQAQQPTQHWHPAQLPPRGGLHYA